MIAHQQCANCVEIAAAIGVLYRSVYSLPVFQLASQDRLRETRMRLWQPFTHGIRDREKRLRQWIRRRKLAANIISRLWPRWNCSHPRGDATYRGQHRERMRIR